MTRPQHRVYVRCRPASSNASWCPAWRRLREEFVCAEAGRYPAAKIARVIGTNRSTVMDWIKKHGLPRFGRGGDRRSDGWFLKGAVR